MCEGIGNVRIDGSRRGAQRPPHSLGSSPTGHAGTCRRRGRARCHGALRLRIRQPGLGLCVAGQRLRRAFPLRPSSALVSLCRAAARRDRIADQRRAGCRWLGVAQGAAPVAAGQSGAARMAGFAGGLPGRHGLERRYPRAGDTVVFAVARALSLPGDGAAQLPRAPARRQRAPEKVPLRAASAAGGAVDRTRPRSAADALCRSGRAHGDGRGLTR
ncbi:hypothetical protein SDC9_169894 [bioreactor metagenome]|uniref:Uncharacterized protein n=1 Tax=bioreactor metagenome TaxID=1076179 RepID=A0A645G6I8_9ZZZZ